MEFSHIGCWCKQCGKHDFLAFECECGEFYCLEHRGRCECKKKKTIGAGRYISRKNNTIKDCEYCLNGNSCQRMQVCSCKYCSTKYCAYHVSVFNHKCKKFVNTAPKMTKEQLKKRSEAVRFFYGHTPKYMNMVKRRSNKLHFINDPMNPISSVVDVKKAFRKTLENMKTPRIVMGIVYPVESNYQPAFNYFEGRRKVARIVDILERQCDVDLLFRDTRYRIFHLKTRKVLPNQKTLRELVNEGVISILDILVLGRDEGRTTLSEKIATGICEELGIENWMNEESNYLDKIIGKQHLPVKV